MRAILVPVAHGFGTSSRLVAVGRALRARGHQATFAAGRALRGFLTDAGFESVEIGAVRLDRASSKPLVAQLLQGEARGGFLHRQVEDIRRAIRGSSADVVVFSQNNAAALAAAIEGIPSVSIFHPGVMEFRDLDTLLGLFLLWRKTFAVKRRYRLKRVFTSSLLGDLNYIPSIEPLVYWPLLQPPEIYLRKRPVEMVGALLRRSEHDLPSREQIRSDLGFDARPLVFATLGGELADARFVDAIVTALRRAACDAFVTAGPACSDADLERWTGAGIRVVRYTSASLEIMKACDLLIWHGGHETMMEAAAFGKSAIGIPHQYDQERNVRRWIEAGAGLRLAKEGLSVDDVGRAVDRILHRPGYAAAAVELKRINASLGGAGRVAEEMERLVT